MWPNLSAWGGESSKHGPQVLPPHAHLFLRQVAPCQRATAGLIERRPAMHHPPVVDGDEVPRPEAELQLKAGVVEEGLQPVEVEVETGRLRWGEGGRESLRAVQIVEPMSTPASGEP